MIRATIIFVTLYLYPTLLFGQAQDTTLAFKYKKQALQFADNLQYDSARIYYHQAAKIYQTNQQWNRYYRARLKEGHQLKLLKKYDQATNLARTVMAAVRQNKKARQSWLEAACWKLIGTTAYNQEHNQKAVEAYLKAEKILTKSKEDSLELLSVMVFKAAALFDLAHHSEALSIINEQEKTLAKYPTSPGIKTIRLDLYLIRCNIQIAYLRLYDKALETCYKAITLLNTMPPTKLNLHDKAQFFYNQVLIYKDQGKLLKAKNNCRQYMTLMTQAKGKKSVETADGILQLGKIYAREKKLDSATYFVQKSLNLYLLAYKADDPALAYVYNNLVV